MKRSAFPSEPPATQDYLALIAEADTIARQIVQGQASLDYSVIFHTIMNLKLSPEARLTQGLRLEWIGHVKR